MRKFWRENGTLKNLAKEQHADSLPIPPTVLETIARDEKLSPIGEADFARLAKFFQEQEVYFRDWAERELQSKDVLLTWAKRVPQLLEIIRRNTRIITEPMFEDSLDQLKQAIEKFVDGENYVVFLHGDNITDAQKHSTFFLAKKLGFPPKNFITEKDLQNRQIQDFLNNGGKVIIADDASYSAQNINDHLFDIQQAAPKFQPKNLHVSLVGTTNTALKRLKESGLESIHASYRIPELRDVFQPDDYRILRFMNRPDHQGESVQIVTSPEEVLTLFWQKVPDNFCHPLRKWYNKFWDGKKHHFWPGYLVDDSPTGIHPSYRDGKTFLYS